MPTIRRIVRDEDGTTHVWTPHRYADGMYKLAKPEAGLNRNLDDNAVTVATLEEAIELIAQRYSLRMSEDGKGPPSLIGPDSIVVS